MEPTKYAMAYRVYFAIAVLFLIIAVSFGVGLLLYMNQRAIRESTPAVRFAHTSVVPLNRTLCNQKDQVLQYPFIMAIERPPIIVQFIRTIWSIDEKRTVLSDQQTPSVIYLAGDEGIDTTGTFTISQALKPGVYELRIAAVTPDQATAMQVGFLVRSCRT